MTFRVRRLYVRNGEHPNIIKNKGKGTKKKKKFKRTYFSSSHDPMTMWDIKRFTGGASLNGVGR